MFKLHMTAAAAALLVILATPGPARADERPADGVRVLDQHEFSAHRRRYRHRHVRRHYSPRVYYRRPYYRPYAYAAAPFFPFPFAFGAPFVAPRYSYRPYYGGYYPAYWGHRRYWGGPGVSVSFGFGPRYWW